MDDNYLMSGSADETIMIWDMQEYVKQGQLTSPNTQAKRKSHVVHSLGSSFDVVYTKNNESRMIAVDDNNCIQVREWMTKCLNMLRIKSYIAKFMTFGNKEQSQINLQVSTLSQELYNVWSTINLIITVGLYSMYRS